MKASELKPGDHYTYTRFDGKGPHYRLGEGRTAVCVKAGVFPGDDAPVPVGRQFNGCPSGDEVELVPMPAPYVVGKEYRTRGGRKARYTGPHRGVRAHDWPHEFAVDPGEHGGRGPWSYTASGFHLCGGAPAPGDIMGEWREAESLCIHGHNQGNKDSTPMKRTLPTVTLDQIFETLKEQGACWAKDGPIALAHKLNSIIPSKGTAPLTFRALVRCVQSHSIDSSDAAWLCRAMGEKLLPQGLKDQMGSQMTFESPKMFEAIDEWENPKPKPPEYTLAGIKPGTRFQFYRSPGYVQTFEYLKLCSRGWPELKEKGDTLHVCLQNGSLLWSSAPDTEVFITSAPKA